MRFPGRGPVAQRAQWTILHVLLIGMTGCREAPPPLSRAEHIRLAEEALKQERYLDAADAYEKAAANGPPDGQLLKKQAEALSNAWDFVEAAGPARRAADLLPEDEEAQLLAATVLLRRGGFDEVIERMEAFLTRHPGHVQGSIALANAMARLTNANSALAAFVRTRDQNDYKDLIATIRDGATRWTDLSAEQTFQRAMKLMPEDVTLQLAMANFFVAAGRADEAASVLERVTERYPNRARANHALGVYYVHRGRVAEAERLLQRAVPTDYDQRSLAAWSLARLYMDIGREDQARAVLVPLTLDIEDHEVSVRLARLEWQLNLRDRAIGRLDHTLKRDPRAADAAVLKAQILLASGTVDEAVTLARAAVAAAPTLAEARSTLGQALSRAGDIESAFDEFAEAVRLSPGVGNHVIELARLALTLGRRTEATAFARDAARMNPKDPDAALLPARAFMLASDYGAARQSLLALRPRVPVSAGFLSLLGTLHAAQGDDNAAKAAFKGALELEPDSPDALAGIALIEVRHKLGAAARNRVEMALARHPRDPRYLHVAAQVYAADNDQARADMLLKAALASDRSHLPSVQSLLTPAFTSTHPAEARRVLETFLEVRPRAIEVRYQLGRLYEQAGLNDAALRQYQFILAEAPRLELEEIKNMAVVRARSLEPTLGR